VKEESTQSAGNINRKKYWWIIPLLAINTFNVIFIIISLKGYGFFRETLRPIGDYFIGFHLYVFIFVLIIMLSFFLLKKISLIKFRSSLFLVFLLFSTAINLSLFPEFNKAPYSHINHYLIKKVSPSMKEIVLKSPASMARGIKSYLNMNELIAGKILIVPSAALLEKDIYFKVFITPEKIEEKEYEYVLTDRKFELIKKNPLKAFDAITRAKEIKKYLIVNGSKEFDKLYLFTYDASFVFVPSGLLKNFSLKAHD